MIIWWLLYGEQLSWKSQAFVHKTRDPKFLALLPVLWSWAGNSICKMRGLDRFVVFKLHYLWPRVPWMCLGAIWGLRRPSGSTLVPKPQALASHCYITTFGSALVWFINWVCFGKDFWNRSSCALKFYYKEIMVTCELLCSH